MSPYSESYVRLILGLAPLIVCYALRIEEDRLEGRQHVMALGTALLFAFAVNSRSVGAWAVLPWLLFTLALAFQAVRRSGGSTGRLAELAAFLYLPVGGIWALFDQLHFQPLGFSAIIVLLTGVHFHYAGFALPKLTGMLLQRRRYGPVAQGAAWGVILGVPLVAVGITTSQLALPYWVETLAVSILAGSAFMVSVTYVQWSCSTEMPVLARLLFSVAGLSLSGGMVLALLYGWRWFFPVEWATIPLMYAFHGTLNSVGFSLPGFLGWGLLSSTTSPREIC